MPREKEAYRDQLERIIEAFPGREYILPSELSKWLKRDIRTVRRLFSFKKGFGISIVQLAREMLP